MFFTFKKWTILYLLSLAVLVFGFVAIMWQGEAVQTSADGTLSAQMPTLIIDPGHGGEDGGAVASDGTIESLINLSIAEKAADLAELLGWDVCMTRETDISIHDAGAETLREKKVSDLKNRVKICNQVENGILLSIHQNSLPGAPSVKGAQVFYNEQAGSLELAQAIQTVLNTTINQEHQKEVKEMGSSSYLMKNVTCPAVLIECGFLSNPEETQRLKTSSYQFEIAFCIISALSQYFQN